MKQITKQDLKKALRDRWWLGLAIVNAVVGLIVILIISFSIEPKETQVITHYSSFGITGFYRNYWYHLLSYAVLEFVVVAAHVALSLKLYQIGRRDLSLALLWSTFGLSVMLLIYALSIISIAALG